MENSEESKKLMNCAFDFTKTGEPNCKTSATYHGRIAVLLVETRPLALSCRPSSLEPSPVSGRTAAYREACVDYGGGEGEREKAAGLVTRLPAGHPRGATRRLIVRHSAYSPRWKKNTRRVHTRKININYTRKASNSSSGKI
jgi:hypothetical protein